MFDIGLRYHDNESEIDIITECLKLEQVLVIIVIAVIIAVMIKRKNESEEDEESGDKLNETAASMTYQPGNSRSEIQE